jgi:acyl carrier protein
MGTEEGLVDIEAMVFDTVRDLVRRRHGEDRDVGADSDLFDDLELDSLDVAELSARLEEDYGTDPYTEGLTPRTIREVLAFYPAPA